MEPADVLVIDDDPAINQLFLLAAKKNDVSCVTALNGQEGMNKFDTTPFKLVITDLEMPKIDGIRFIEEIRRQPKFSKFPVVLISANFAKHDSELGFSESVYLVPKPITLHKIEEIFRNFGLVNKNASDREKEKTIATVLFNKCTEKAKLLIELALKVKPNVTQEETNYTKTKVYILKVLTKTVLISISVDDEFETQVAKTLANKQNFTPEEKDKLQNKLNETFLKKAIEMLAGQGTKVSMCSAMTLKTENENSNILYDIHAGTHSCVTLNTTKGNMSIRMVSC